MARSRRRWSLPTSRRPDSAQQPKPGLGEVREGTQAAGRLVPWAPAQLRFRLDRQWHRRLDSEPLYRPCIASCHTEGLQSLVQETDRMAASVIEAALRTGDER